MAPTYSTKLGLLFGLLLSVLAAGGRSAEVDLRSGTDKVLEEASWRADLGLFRHAKASLDRRLKALGPDAPPSSGYHRLAALLAEIYYRSGQYDDAIRTAWHGRTDLDSDRWVGQLRVEERRWWRHRAARLLVRAYMARNRRADAEAVAPQPAAAKTDLDRARRILAEALANARGISDPVARLELLALRAELAELGDEAAASRWAEAAEFARKVQAQYEHSRSGFDRYARSTRLLARCYAALERHDRVVAEVAGLVPRFHPEEQAHHARRMWCEIAGVYHKAGNHAREVSAWEKVRELHPKLRLDAAGENATRRIHGRIQQGDDLRRLARALKAAGGDSEPIQRLEDGRGSYREALALIADASAKAEDENKLDALQTITLQGLLDVSHRVLEHQHRRQVGLSEEMFAKARQLHDLLEASLLGGDPRLFQLKVNLGAACVKRRDFYLARGFLAEAHEFFRTYEPRTPIALVRILNLLSEVERDADGGSLAKTEQHLEAAERLYREASLSDENLGLSIRINRARLAATCGQYTQAGRLFEEIVRKARSLGPPAEESLRVALRDRGMVNLSLLKLDNAEALCREALDRCRENPPVEQRECLPYYLALAEVQLVRRRQVDPERRDLEKLRRMEALVRRALDIPVHANQDDWMRLHARADHQLAMVHFLRYETTRDPLDRAAAQRTWQPIADQDQWPLEKARALHHLSRLGFVRWRQEQAERRQWARENLGAYRKRLKQFEEASETFQRELTAYRRDQAHYLKTLRQYEEKPGNEKSPEEHHSLSVRRARLEERGESLIGSRKDLQSEEEALNGLCDEYFRSKKGDDPLLSPAAENARRAVEILAQNRRYPSLQFLARCNYAEILRAISAARPACRAEAIGQLQEAVKLVETLQLLNFGEDVQTGKLFGRYAAAHHLLVSWLVEDSRREHAEKNELLKQALVYAELGRNRNFLGRIRGDGVHLTDGLTEAGRRRLQDATRQYVLGQDPTDSLARLREALSSHPAYRAVLGELLHLAAVSHVVDQWIRSSDVLLYYYLGPTDSYVFLTGATPGAVEVFPLGSADSDGASAEDVAKWVETYVAALKNRTDFRTELRRGGSKLLAVTDRLVPVGVRQRILRLRRSRAIVRVTILPEGRLCQLPFEALLVGVGSEPKYLIDEFNPDRDSPPRVVLAYAPSIMILHALRHRPGPVGGGMPRVLALGKDDFSDAEEDSEALQRLESAEKGAGEIAGLFDAVALRGPEATEARLRERLEQLHGRADPYFLFLATHGIVEEDRPEQTRLILTRPPTPQPEAANDGRLELGEVYGLDLSGCELAVLSACRTNVGPPRGATMARAFLSAGARRVVSSQWEVADKTTAELMGHFFAEIARQLKQQPQGDFALALQSARSELRRQENGRWAEPFYWAPLVLIGPAAGGQPRGVSSP